MNSIIASRTYYPGDLIYTDEAFIRVLPRDKKDEQCEVCKKSSSDLISCDECYSVKYCGQECKMKDSSDHKNECGKLDRLRGDAAEDCVRLLGRLIFKIKGKDWRDIQRNILGNTVSFEDVDSHYEEMISNPRFNLLYKEVKDALRDFIGEENMPREDYLIKIVGKVKFSACEYSAIFPYEFYLGMEKFKHCCIPNSNLEIINNVVKVWAIKKIESSEEITVTRRNILTSALMRSPITDDSLKVCQCTECLLPYGESPLTKVIDERRAYNIIRLTEKVINISQTLSNLDLEEDFRLRLLVDKALEKHEGVLGATNALHLKLLAIKAMTLEGTDIQKKMHLLELEKHMSSVFGDHYLEMHKIYKGLVVLNFKLGNVLEAALYLKKAEKVQIHQSDN